VLGFPVLLCGAIGAMVWALSRGQTADEAVIWIGVTVTVSLALLERWIPVFSSWNQARGDLVGDAAHSFFSLLLIPEILRVATLSGLAGLAAWIEGAAGGTLWPREWPWLFQIILALVIVEWAQYWIHRAQHAWPLLWRFHAVHHSALRLYWLNAGRVHPLEAVVNYLVAVPVLAVLGCTADVVGLYIVFISVCASAQHANVDFRLGPLNWVLSQGELHRWHHSSKKAEADHNFGAVLIVWDLVFGTYKAPGGWPEKVGVDPIDAYPRGYLGQLLAPFRD